MNKNTKNKDKKSEQMHKFDSPAEKLKKMEDAKFIKRISIKNFDDLIKISKFFSSCIPRPIYRGQADYAWPLRTVIERDVHDFVFNQVGLESYELRIFIESQRRMHNYFDKLPAENDHLSWLSLLRHHGAPTRLLDVTRSIFIAAYFAVNRSDPEKDAAIWIFSRHEIDSSFDTWMHEFNQNDIRMSPFTPCCFGEAYYGPYPKDIKTRKIINEVSFESLFYEDMRKIDPVKIIEAAINGYIEKPGICIAESFWISKRMEAQQGLFIIPFNVRRSFEENMTQCLKTEDTEDNEIYIEEASLQDLFFYSKLIKVRIPKGIKWEITTRLQEMNINDLTLFPDIQGSMSYLSSIIPRNN